MFYQLPPVGDRVSLAPDIVSSGTSIFPDYQTWFYDSGTAALAAALLATLPAPKKNGQQTDAEVILPAYGCPDLVSAVIFAGAKPVLVDLEEDRPWLDICQLRSSINEKTAAIVAVNLFGINERWSQLRDVADQNKLVLIEDSAQYFPAKDAGYDWQGDMVVLSFGRGKPVSMLGGGAVLTKNAALYKRLPQPEPVSAGVFERFLYVLKAGVYNALISPCLYWLPRSLPFLHLGETRYHALERIEAMDTVRSALLAANIQRYLDDSEATDRCREISDMVQGLDKIINLPQMCNIEANRRLLRYPLLIEEKERNRIYHKLQKAGLGASIMYPASLPGIRGLPQVLDNNQCFPNAEKFADRLLTIPTHKAMHTKNIGKIKEILKDSL